MALLTFNKTPTERLIRQFGLIFLPVFLAVVGAIVWSRTRSWWSAGPIWSLGLAVIPLTLWKPTITHGIWTAWVTVTYPIAWTMSHIALLMTYGVAIVPLGLLFRVTGKDPLERRHDPMVTSYWKKRDADGNRARYFRQF